ncbi:MULTISPECIES: cytochrome c [unclassified Mesorhizobium]|uniref:c-type cytochrome n=1 Tax=unclassified Mesorhizobium TaxID=325217 RepID=UPI000FD43C5A|nr:MULTISPECIES: cytochrome c [unclassified Mesorhizobium]RUV71821.1 cytochrome c [Mesorhizobium sp. M5C.F.Ca.IN.020.14.1.1]RUV18845.1 cytochrome c [Mesorhizobium sp. M5C.F.Ca.IN.020.32.2.1]RWG48537.1 MAG: cytochrome c [Mesorhizobium sp.]RWH40350.1 MAG: cytochrome c [Mesorhizobium sp.]RWH57557.1 MAG: cytochrome c [Mesorhizobium sp.]
MRRASVLLSMLGVAAAGLGLAWTWPRLTDRMAGDEASAATIALGKTIYTEHCASCHGANLEGQRDWKSPLPSGRMPAPPHDAIGHTWHHPDGVLFRITKEGPAAVVGGGYRSDMPGFGNVLTDEEIRAVLAFIKSTWPERERAYQAQMSRQEREKTQ